jgi:hypothetical protein
MCASYFVHRASLLLFHYLNLERRNVFTKRLARILRGSLLRDKTTNDGVQFSLSIFDRGEE